MTTEARIVITATDRASAALKSVGASMQGVNSKIAGLSGALAGLAVVGFAQTIKKSLDATDAMGDAAAAAGFTAESFQELRFAASQSGINIEKFNSSMARFGKTMGEARDPTSAASDDFRKLGINVLDVNGKMRDGETVFTQAFTALSKIESQADRSAIAFKLFGREAGSKMAAMAGEGTEALDKMRAKARELGLVMDNETVAAAGAVNDKIDALSNKISMKFNKAIADNADSIGILAEAFVDLGEKGFQAFEKLANAGKSLGTLLAPGPNLHKYSIEIDNLTESISKNVKALQDYEKNPTKISFFGGMIDAGKVRKETDDMLARLNEVTQARDAMLGTPSPKTIETKKASQADLGADESTNKKIAALRKELEAVSLSSLAEEEKINESYSRRAVIVQNSLNAKIINEQRAGEIITGLNQKRVEDIAKIQDDSEIAKSQERAARAYEGINAQFFTEQQLLQQSLLDKQFIVETAFQEGLIKEVEKNAQLEALEQEHQNKMASIRNDAIQGSAQFGEAVRRRDLQGVLGSSLIMLDSLSKSSKTAFKIQKTAALAKAVVSLPSAVIQSYENGGGFPFGLIPAGIMLATGLKNIQQIKSSEFGGGGSAGSVSGGGASTSFGDRTGSDAFPSDTLLNNQRNQERPPLNVTINIPGSDVSLYTGKQLRELITAMGNEITEMGGNVKLAINQ